MCSSQCAQDVNVLCFVHRLRAIEQVGKLQVRLSSLQARADTEKNKRRQKEAAKAKLETQVGRHAYD